MCGIVGIAGRQDPSWLSKMNGLQVHRGPDDGGEYRDPDGEVSLAMRRLSILDLTGGHQPMTNEDGSLWIVYNGEIYNSPALRAELLEKGHQFKTSNSDTEVLLHLYEEKQEDMAESLNGMFAFVIYDRNKRIFFGARDQVGIKPLYYLRQPDFFAFASEINSFLPLPGRRPEIDRASLFHYMSLMYVPGEDSIFKDTKRLPAGHWFKYDLQARSLKVRKYWDLNFTNVENRTADEWSESIRFELREAVKRWTLSDVPIACSLSGGVDSSAIVGLLSEIGYGPIKTYSLGFAGLGEDQWNELPLARKVADRWGTEHHELVLEPEALLEDLVKMVWHLGEPYGGGLPSWYVFRFMGQEVKVGFTGTGGDELFGNYGKFRPLEASRLGHLGMAAHRKFGPGRLAKLPHVLREPLAPYFLGTSYYFSDKAKRGNVFQSPIDESFNTANLLRNVYDLADTPDARNALAYVDFKTQLPEEFLLMTDRFSMAHSLEARVPFLDRRVVELAMRINPTVRTRPHDLKYLLKQAVGDLLPPEILSAEKRGFVIPVKLWLRNQLRPLAETLLAPERLSRQGLFSPRFYDSFVRPHLEGKADFTAQVWAGMMFQLWHLIFIEQKSVYEPSYTWKDIVREGPAKVFA